MSWAGLEAFDWAVIGVLGLSSLVGIWRGLVSEVLALLAWIAAFIAARAWGGTVADLLAGWLQDPPVRQAAGLLAVFVATMLLFAAARFFFSRLLRAIGLGLVDRFLGMLFGIVRGILIVLTVVVLCGMTDLPRRAWWRDAYLAPPLETAAMALKAWLPPQVAQRIHYR